MTTTTAFLSGERRVLVERWVGLVLGTYPPAVARTYAEDPDEFRNPVGHAIRRSLEGLVDALLRDFDAEHVARLLDPVVRIRAVQAFTPPDAVGFVVLFKRVVRDVAQVVGENPMDASALAVLDERIDRAALVACDLDDACRRRISSLGTRERRQRRVDLHAGDAFPAQSQERPASGDASVSAGESTP
jgi:hypothetical protein